MQLMLAYSFMCKVSNWTMAGFYSEVYVAKKMSGSDGLGPIIL